MHEHFWGEINVQNVVSHTFEAYGTSIKSSSKFTVFRETRLYVSGE